MNKIHGYTLRLATAEDVTQALGLIQELATYEREPEAVTVTVDSMIQDGFGENPSYIMWVVEKDNRIDGIAVCYDRYSTWKGRMLYLEDLVVTESQRGLGLGKALFENCVHYAQEKNYQGMVWQVLEWNTPAIEFYQYFGAQLDPEWVNGKLDKQQLDNWKKRDENL
jgi:GNAT superfamily N-acetyltransferase